MASASSPVYPRSTDWDPLNHTEQRNPSAECRKRLRRDMKELQEQPLPGIFAVRDENNLTVVHVLITGPFETPYEGGFFWFVVNCPDDYPHSPPRVRLMTTGGGVVRFNPNLYANGKVCLSILGTWTGPGWSPVQSLSSICLSIQSLMNERPYHNEPGFEVARDPRDVERYNQCIRFETLRVAVIQMMRDSYNPSTSIPEPLKETVKDLFPSFYDAYELTCLEAINRGLDGQPMQDPFGQNKGVMQYSQILEALQELSSTEGTVEDDDDAEK